jgi:hypothetical protein
MIGVSPLPVTPRGISFHLGLKGRSGSNAPALSWPQIQAPLCSLWSSICGQIFSRCLRSAARKCGFGSKEQLRTLDEQSVLRREDNGDGLALWFVRRLRQQHPSIGLDGGTAE